MVKNKMTTTPIITIDGPTASGKGTVAQKVADALGFHYLDSGALYRIVALASQQQAIDWQAEAALAAMVSTLDIIFEHNQIIVNNQNVSESIRTEAIAQGASTVAVHPQVRKALFEVQRNFCQSPGLVADGRDMGTVIFPDAATKIFLTASTEVRAKRRYEQLKARKNGQNANYDLILKDLQARDARDQNRQSAPLIAASDAMTVNTDDLNIEQAVSKILLTYKENS